MYYDEAQELACAILDLNYDDLVDNGKENEIEEKLYEELGIDMEQFMNVASKLLLLTYPIKSDLTGTCYHAFGIEDKEVDLWRAICKKSIN